MAGRSIIINEFLTFVQNKVDVLDDVSLVQICATHFTDSVVEDSKNQLYESLPNCGRCILRKGDDKRKKNIKDVIKIFREIAPELQPIYVAQDLNKLPPVTFDHIDVTRFMKDLICMKNDLQNIRNETVSKSEFIGFEAKMNTDLTRLGQSVSKLETKSCTSQACLNKVNVTKIADKIDNMQSGNGSSPVHSGRSSSEPVRRLSYRDIAVTSLSQASATQQLAKINPQSSAVKLDDSFTIVQRKKRRRINNMTGSAIKPSKLQVIETTAAIYISRLKKITTTEDIKEHISDMNEHCINVELLKQNHESNFNSFKVTILQDKLDTFLASDFWPPGIKYRRFRERIMNVVKS